MTKAITPHRWFPGWRASPPAAEVDAADYGTAFGLDLSLSPIEFEQSPAAPPPGRQPGWMWRLAVRRKPLA